MAKASAKKLPKVIKQADHLRTNGAVSGSGFRLKELKQLPCFDDVVTMLRQGHSHSEIARFIKHQGFFDDIKEQAVAMIVKRYVKSVAPASLCVYGRSGEVAKAFDKVKQCLVTVDRLDKMTKKQERIVNKTADQINALMDYQQRLYEKKIEELEREEPLSAAGETESEEDKYYKTMLESIEKGAVESAGMLPGLPVGLYLVASDAYKHMLKGMAECRQANKEIIEALCKIFPEGTEEMEEVDQEAKVGEWVQQHYPGNRVVFDALTNPDSRRKVASVFNRLVASKGLQEAILDFDHSKSGGNGTSGNNGKPVH